MYDELGSEPAALATAPARDYWPETQHIRDADIGSVLDFAVRYVIIISAGFALYFATGEVFYLGWLAVYLLTNLAYCAVLMVAKGPVYLPRYLTYVAMNMVTSGIYSFLPLYLWFTSKEPALMALALCGIIGHAMFNLARHTRLTLVSYWDMSVILVSIAAIGLYEIRVNADLTHQIVIAVGCIAVMGYYAVALHATVRDREELYLQREDAVEAMKISAMSQITAGVAHDFNNKLTVIQGNIDLAALTHDPAERADRLGEARAAAEQAADVVAHMRAFVRKSPLMLKQVALEDVVSDLRHALAPYLPDNITFIPQISGGIRDIYTDPSLLRTALLNLALNSVDAMAHTGGTLELRIAPGDERNWAGKAPAGEGPFVRFEICDTGPGLPPQNFTIAQEPFYTTKPAGMGTGLGLSMVKGFTEQLGGGLSLQNRPVGGLDASILLPVSPT